MYNRNHSLSLQDNQLKSKTIDLSLKSKITVYTVHKMLEKDKDQGLLQQALRQSSSPSSYQILQNHLREKERVRYRRKKDVQRRYSRNQEEPNNKKEVNIKAIELFEKRPSQSNGKNKTRQQKLLNQTMKIMSNNMYSASINENELKIQENPSEIDNQQSKNETNATKQANLNGSVESNRKTTLKEKFRANLLRYNFNSINKLGQPQLSINSFSCEVKGIKMRQTVSTNNSKGKEKSAFWLKNMKKTTAKEQQYSYTISSPQIILKKRNKSSTAKDPFDIAIGKPDKKQNLSLYQFNLRKMLQCLDLILLSFHCRMDEEGKPDVTLSSFHCTKEISLRNTRYVQSAIYYFYIGDGNNQQLVRSIFRKRGWWVQTDNVRKAHLVWTQLKVRPVLNKMQSIDKVSASHSKLEALRPISELEDQGSKLGKYSKLFHSKHTPNPSQFNLTSSFGGTTQAIQPPQLLHNHYRFNQCFGNKNNLFFNLEAFYQYSQKNIDDIVPVTHYVEWGNQKLIEKLEYIFQKEPKNIWIVKPAENSNRGKKIFLTTSLQQIKEKLEIQKKLIVQKYIKNVFLYEGRKFDIRTYLLAITINGRLKFYFYEEGYLRTSSYLFTLNNLKDRHIHLTNDPVQEQSFLYGKFEEGNKLSYSQFQRYISNKHPLMTQNVSHLHDQMKWLSKDTVLACYPKLSQKKNKFGFEVFGLDFIIDSNFKPLLIQVNSNPCLDLPSNVLERVIPKMLENMFRLAIDPLFRPSVISKVQSYFLYDKFFLLKNKFSLIFDEKYDRDQQWQTYLENYKNPYLNIDDQPEYN